MSENYVERVRERLKKLQPEKHDAVWMVCEQLKDIIGTDESAAEIVLRDLELKAMQPSECEKQLKAYADKHKCGSFACVTPEISDKILREFYGLPSAEKRRAADGSPPLPTAPRGKLLSLEDFL